MLNEIDLSRADLNLLVLFEVVLKERHVGRAAEKLSLSPSAVSHGLSRLRRLFNDPLFLRTPKGVVPTARATELAEPIADVLARIRNVVSTAEPFDAATSRRRFTIGAPDAISAVLLPPFLAELRRTAPGIDISARQILPQGPNWQTAFAELEERRVDVVIVPELGDIPARFAAHTIGEEEFVIAMRAGHPFARTPTLERYCAMLHLVTSLSGDSSAYVDRILAGRGLSRRVALTVPNFMLAMALVAQTDFVAAMPRSFVAMHGMRFGVTSVEAPLPLDRFPIRLIAPKVAMMDAGIAWLFEAIAAAWRTANAPRAVSPRPPHVTAPRRRR
jgi:DNA-binding transcriptional LysR family regulator